MSDQTRASHPKAALLTTDVEIRSESCLIRP